MKFDLHVHTNYSDGRFSPSQVIDLAIERQLNGVAITDHDTVDGISESIEYSKKYKDFIIIPGIEFGCIHQGEEVHILGYFINYKSKELLEAIELLKLDRIKRGEKIISKLNDLGIEIDLNEVKNFSKKDFIGRANIARVLVNKKYASSLSEAFKKYLNINAPGYVVRNTLSISETIKLINKIGGIAVLAHPGILKDKKKIINQCIQSGIQGIECFQSKHSELDSEFFKDIAKKNNLLITGGSDCHGENIDGNLLLGKFYVKELEILKMKELI